jgi:hypothetical protein
MSDAYLTSLLLWNEFSADQPVQVSGRDDSRIADAAAQACHASANPNGFTAQFDKLVDALHRWLHGYQDKIKSAYLAIRARDLQLLVVQKDARFDAVFADALTDLDLLIANSRDFDLIDLEVMAVPPISMESLNAMRSSGTVVYDAK